MHTTYERRHRTQFQRNGRSHFSVELQSQKRRDNYVLKEVHDFVTNEVRQSILELQTQSFNSIGALEEWREVLEEDLEMIKVDLDSNIVRRDEWNKFVEHAEGFATGDITEQIMHDIRVVNLK